jgi:GNAT superfamily N-acetyltransferase
VRPLRPVALTFDRIPGGLLLSTEAGWNQIADDWRFMLGAGTSYGFADSDDHLVATGLTVEFAHYGWISMILVTAPYRRRGLATQLMGRCVDALASRRLVPALDASPDGREVYRRLGFRDVGNSTRLVGTLGSEAKNIASDIFKLTVAELPEIAAFDAQWSGTDRTTLLHHLWQRYPAAAYGARRQGRIAGFVLARAGRMSAQIGPLVATDDELAADLLARAGSAINGPVCFDLFDQRTAVRAWLDQSGFRPVTRFIRMVLGETEIFPSDHRVYIIAGPELG